MRYQFQPHAVLQIQETKSSLQRGSSRFTPQPPAELVENVCFLSGGRRRRGDGPDGMAQPAVRRVVVEARVPDRIEVQVA